MFINEIPEIIEIPVFDERDEVKEYIKTRVLLVRTVPITGESGITVEDTQVVSYDKNGKTYGTAIAEIKIIKTRKYENGCKLGSPEKTSGRRRKKNRIGNNNPVNSQSGESIRQGDSSRERDNKIPNGDKSQ